MHVGLTDRLTMAWARLRPALHTVRFRLTCLYSGLFLGAGAGLLAITYLLFGHATSTVLFRTGNKVGAEIVVKGAPFHGSAPHVAGGGPAAGNLDQLRQLLAEATHQHAADQYQLLTQSAIALVITAILAILLGWLAAGRALRPLRTVTSRTRHISEHSLDQRLSIEGPKDEVKALADTIDGLLGRLEAAFEAQRHFVANASHELRTPLTFDRALLEVTLADPNASAPRLRETCKEVLASGEHQERLIEALLTLATSERGLEAWHAFDLAAIAKKVMSTHRADVERQAVRVEVGAHPAASSGNPDLVERLAANLVDNALRYNVDGGFVQVLTGTRDGRALFAVTNSGPIIPSGQLDRLFHPFQRLATDRSNHSDGHGLGLSIVQAIADAHRGVISAHARPGGGMDIEVSFPTSSPHGDCRAESNGHVEVRADRSNGSMKEH